MPILPTSASHIATQEGAFEPQRQNHGIMEIYGLSEGQPDTDVLVLSLSTFSLPVETTEEVEIQFGNESVWVAGRTTVENVSLTVRDYIDQRTHAIIVQWRQLVHNSRTGATGLASQYKKKARAIITDPSGGNQRSWEIRGAWPPTYNPGTIDFSASDQQLLEATLRIDKAIPLFV